MITDDLRQKLLDHSQDHLVPLLVGLNEAERMRLVQDLGRVDLAELRTLHSRRDQRDALPERHRIEPLPRSAQDGLAAEVMERTGIGALKAGEVGFLVVAGGQGTRLGFEHPKGMYPVGPLSKRSLFQIHAEKILAMRRRYGARLPLLVMTSPATDAETRHYFKRKNYFRLPPQDVWFFCQGTMPAVELTTGRLLLEGPGRLCLSPNGHGGTITGLLDSGILDRLADLGVRVIYYFQVDNPLVNLADSLFLGRHLEARAEVSSKVLPKAGPLEKVGNFLLVDGRCSMIEYSDLPEAWAHETDDAGNLRFWAGNPAIHLFDVAFLRKIASEAERLPWHLARKIVPYLDETGQIVKPSAENALKFERFIFDILPQADRWTIHATDRSAEFAPVKNKEGSDSPQTARMMMCAHAADLLGQLGVEVPAGIKVEINPLFALNADDARKCNRQIPPITKHTYLREPKD